MSSRFRRTPAADGLTVGPHGGVVLCEGDDGKDDVGGGHCLRLLTKADRIVDRGWAPIGAPAQSGESTDAACRHEGEPSKGKPAPPLPW
ncbi:hypothetical protein [Frankia gtarii]|uniref:hypothetical protein n=1 Tax=Frankia gtarii TaxID=2950102 RepID=UPI0021C21F32|nr:hypothetical protein [Frankia gtarii]